MEEHLRDLTLEKTMDAYVKGHLDNREAEKLWVELLKRPDYIEYLETELAIKFILSEEFNEDKSAEDEPNNSITALIGGVMERPWKWVAAAACIAILILSINFLTGPEQPDPREMALSKINLLDKLSYSPVLRNESGPLAKPDSLLNTGFKVAISGQTDSAAAIYGRIISQYKGEPIEAKAHLNIGIIHYNNEKYGNAISAFKSAIDSEIENPVLREKALWYLGNAYLKTNTLQEARNVLNKAYSLDGIYRDDAEALLKALDREVGQGQDEPSK